MTILDNFTKNRKNKDYIYTRTRENKRIYKFLITLKDEIKKILMKMMTVYLLIKIKNGSYFLKENDNNSILEELFKKIEKELNDYEKNKYELNRFDIRDERKQINYQDYIKPSIQKNIRRIF